LPNKNHGIEIEGVETGLIGGQRGSNCDNACNLISGNTKSGVSLSAVSPSSSLRIQGNVIGPDISEYGTLRPGWMSPSAPPPVS
jgi:hypothetical protein